MEFDLITFFDLPIRPAKFSLFIGCCLRHHESRMAARRKRSEHSETFFRALDCLSTADFTQEREGGGKQLTEDRFLLYIEL